VIVFLTMITLFYSVTAWKRCHVWRDSLSLITDIIKNYPAVPELHYRRGNIFFINQDYVNAISDYSRAITLFPKHVNAYIYRGLSYEKKGDPDLAAEDFTKALKKTRTAPKYISTAPLPIIRKEILIKPGKMYSN